MLITRQKLCSLLPLLIVLVIPVSGLTTTITSDTQIENLGSVLAQAEHFRTQGKTSDELKQAHSLYQHAAHHGIDVAQYWLGVMYFKGQGTEVDIDKARYWIGLSAKQDYAPAEQFLSEFREENEDDEDDEPDC